MLNKSMIAGNIPTKWVFKQGYYIQMTNNRLQGAWCLKVFKCKMSNKIGRGLKIVGDKIKVF